MGKREKAAGVGTGSRREMGLSTAAAEEVGAASAVSGEQCSSRLEGSGAGWEPSLGARLALLGSSEQISRVVSGGLPSASKRPCFVLISQ